MPGDGRSAAHELARALREVQRRSGRTLRSLEPEVLISDSSLSRYLRGATVPPWGVVRDLCRALDADPTEYRALWEAADRSQQAPDRRRPEAAAGGTGAEAGPPPSARTSAQTPDTPAAEQGAAVPHRRRPRVPPAWRKSHWPYAVAAAVAGTGLGMALTLLMPSAGTAPEAATSVVTALGEQRSRRGAGAPPNVRIFTSRADGYCLDDSLEYGLRTYSCNGMSYQRWTVDTHADGAAQLKNHATGRCVGLDHGGPRAAECSTTAGGRSQRWRLTTWSDASAEVRHQDKGVCLEESAAGPRVRACDRSRHQKWG